MTSPPTPGERETKEMRAIFAKWRRTDHILLHAGEMTAQELRSVKAVLNAVEHEVLAAVRPTPCGGT